MLVKVRPPVTGVGVSCRPLGPTPPSPSTPLSGAPQQYASPLFDTAQVCFWPAEIEEKRSAVWTATGRVLPGFPPQLSGPVSFPIPSSPALLSPQQYATPPFSRAHLERLPKLIAPKVWPPPTGAQVQPLPQYVAPPVAKPHQYP